jgi:16S rRNA (uracil1498-N3)-methyltransferase
MSDSGLIPADGHLFYVADLEQPELDERDVHHAGVLRLRPGELITVCDGAGVFRRARFGSTIQPDGPLSSVSAPKWTLTVGFALTKGSKPEWVVAKLTELGVDCIGGFVGDRSVLRWDEDKQARALQRWTTTARSAAMQSRRAWLPEVIGVRALGDFGPAVARADRGGRALTSADRTVLIGPEGGWSDTECQALPDAVGLGRSVLRAETAALVCGWEVVRLRESATKCGQT